MLKVEMTRIDSFETKLFHLNDVIVGIATEIGPRILYFAHRNRPKLNLFGVLPDAGVQTPEGFWSIYGGHRLWSSPEAKPRSYSIDNRPISIAVNEDSITIYGNPEIENSTQKEIAIKPLSANSIQVTHTIKNIGRWPIRLGCWALSIMRQNGFAIIPLQSLKVDEEGLLPDRHITIWPYNDLSDKRLALADGYIFVKQDTEAKNPLKVGTMANPSWTVYWVDGYAFAKKFRQEEGEYPDFGCSVEVYTNSAMLELETLGPLRTLNPYESVRHAETWKTLEVGDLALKPESVKEKLEPLLQE